MKAVEYHKNFDKLVLESDLPNAIYQTFKNMVIEVTEIAKARKASSESAFISIVKEMDVKSKAFIKLANTKSGAAIKKDAFKIFLEINSPKINELIGW